MELEHFKKLVSNRIAVNLEDVSDETILREADKRGLYLGVSYTDITELMVATVQEDWICVRKLVARLARDNLGRII